AARNSRHRPGARLPRMRSPARLGTSAQPATLIRGGDVAALLSLSRWIDRLNEWVGHWLAWLVLAAVLISAGNAAVRKAFDTSSNAFLEIQWYLFSAVFLVAAGYTLLRQEHVKIDVILHRFTRRTQVKIEIFCIVAFLFPFVLSVISEVWPLFA